MSSLLSLMFSFQQNLRTGGWKRLCPEQVAQTMYTHIHKCKNNKIKRRKKNMLVDS
jgi:hypothetical protein